MIRRRSVILALALATLAPAGLSRAADVDVHNTQAAAIELPSIYGMLRRPGDNTGSPLDQNSDSSYAFQAYLDTGTSGIILSAEDTDLRGILPELDSTGNPVNFSDIAVSGSVSYNVSEPLDLRLGRYTGESLYDTFDTAGANAYFNQVTPGARLQLSVTPVDPESFDTPLNIIGMPVLKNKVMVVDARMFNHLVDSDDIFAVHYDSSVESLADFPKNSADVPLPQLQTWIYNKGDTTDHSATPFYDPGIPVANHTVRMSYGDFSGFTQTTPNEAGIQPPTLAHNPFIGPAPFSTNPSPDDPPGITLKRLVPGSANPSSATGSWLFDSGAQISFMSSAMAMALGVELSFDENGDPVLTDLATHQAPDGLFSVPLGGAGGDAGTILGFNVDELDLPTTDGLIRFHDVPIAVLDITVSDGTHEYTLDGDFGMNLLLPSFDVNADNATSGPFDFISFDEASGLLYLTDTTVPEPAAFGLFFVGGMILLAGRRRAGSCN